MHTIRPGNRVAVLVVLRDHLVAVEQHRPNHARVSHKGPSERYPYLGAAASAAAGDRPGTG